MLNFKACGTPLNIMQLSKYFAQIFFIMIGTTSKGGTVKLVTFIFPQLAKGHPSMYVCCIDCPLQHVNQYSHPHRKHTCCYFSMHLSFIRDIPFSPHTFYIIQSKFMQLFLCTRMD